MARSRRSSGLDMNFDGLTDAVTNLVGALILIVMLSLGITREAVAQDKDRDTPTPVKPNAGEKPIAPLQARLNSLRAEIKNVEQEVRRLEGKVPELQKQVKDLLEKTKQVQPPKEEKKKEEPKEPKQVEFRPPLSRVSNKSTNVCLICDGGRVALMDFDAAKRAYGNIYLLAEANKQKLLAGQEFKQKYALDVGDYDVEAKITPGAATSTGRVVTMVQEAIPKKREPGESLAEFRKANSPIRQRLAALNAEKSVVQFAVYPDSFDTFRAVRAVAWEMKFDVGWDPMPTGVPYRFAPGNARTN